MSVFCSFVLGVVQGLTEFLPVSSSGHLILVQKLFGLSPDLFLNVSLHFGTLVAVLLFYKKQVWQLLTHPFCKKAKLVYLATIPTVAIGLLAKLFLPSLLDGLLLPVGFALTFGLLCTSQFATKQKHNLLTTKYKTALLCGVVQGIAVLPGLSRSGATICLLKWCGTKNDSATELSFLMSIPVILGSIVLTLPDVLSTNATVDIPAVAVGVVTSFVFGFLSLGLLKKISQKGEFAKFAPYMVLPFLLSCVTM
ncbi:MAG: undecaprenyl-diphosphate phosphatase [Clostridia bacterium]|nr:undecaprenyl-diphosphate phosphatase [Clostridia bacterium]